MTTVARPSFSPPEADLPARPLLVGFSGGRDSVALLDRLWRTRREKGLTVAAAHLNHMIRGADADGDQEFCREFCHARGIPFFTVAVNVPAAARAAGMNLEAAARAARLAFFARICEENGLAGVVLAHHADDQAETVFLRLLRGAGWRGLRGMAPVTELTVPAFPPEAAAPARRLTVFRPFLDTPRAALAACARERRLPWREDLTNHDPAYARNWLRERFFPVLAALYPDYRERLCALAARARAICAAAPEGLTGRREWGGVFVPSAGTEVTPPALARALAAHRPPLCRADYAALERLLAGAAITVNLSHGWHLRREADGYFARPPEAPPAWNARVFAAPPFVMETPEFRLEARMVELRGTLPDRDDPGVEYLRPPRFPLTVRPPLPGERFRPCGRTTEERIAVIAAACGLPARCRGALPVLADAEGALWLAPVRPAARALTPDFSGAALRVECRLRGTTGGRGGKK